jgi:sensor domain CHASE-containing protein
MLYRELDAREDRRLVEDARLHLAQAQHDAARAMNEMMEALQRLCRAWETSGGRSGPAWEAEAERDMQEFPGLIALGRADAELIVRWGVASTQDKSALGIDLKRLPGNEDFLRALETDTPQASAVKDFTYVDGRGIVIDLPMHLQGKFAGILLGRFDTDAFFRHVLGPEFLRKFDVSVEADGKAAFNTYPAGASDATPWRVRDKMEGQNGGSAERMGPQRDAQAGIYRDAPQSLSIARAGHRADDVFLCGGGAAVPVARFGR